MPFFPKTEALYSNIYIYINHIYIYLLYLYIAFDPSKEVLGNSLLFPKTEALFIMYNIYIYSAFGPLKEVFGEFMGSNEHKLCFRPGIQDVMCAEFFGGCESVVNGFRWGLMQNLSHV